MDSLQKLIAFLDRHFGPPRLFLLVAAWILALGVWGMVARHFLPMEHGTRWPTALELRAPLYAKFDSGWYLSIIEWGYGAPPPAGKQSAHAFFPLYPLAAKVLRDTFAIDGLHAGLLVSYVCFFLAASLFLREGRERLGEAGAWSAVGFLLLFPTSFFFASVYAESMLLLFSLLLFRDARREGLVRPILWGIGMGLTRAFAIAAGPAVFLAALQAPVRSPVRRRARALLLGAVPVATVFLWILGMGWLHREPGLYFRSLEGWHRGASPFSGAVAFFQKGWDHLRLADWKRDHALLLDFLVVLLFLGIFLYQLARRRWSDAAWTACAAALPISTGLSGGIPRFFASVYPTYFALTEVTTRSPQARRLAMIFSAALLLWASARFVNWMWVA